MNPVWVTVLVAVIGLSGPLSSQWVNAVNQRRLAVIERDSKRAERQLQSREDAYAKFLVAARAFQAAMRSNAGGEDKRLDALREAAAYIELNAPELADGPLSPVIAEAERWTNLSATNSRTAPVVREVDADFQHALKKLRGLMREDIAAAR